MMMMMMMEHMFYKNARAWLMTAGFWGEKKNFQYLHN